MRKEVNKKRRQNVTNQRYGMLTVIKYIGIDKHKKTIWKCKCDCGNYKNVSLNSLTTKKVKSCGCLQHPVGKNSPHYSGYEDLGGHYWSTIKHGANKRNLELTITIKEIWELFLKQDRRCAISGVFITLHPSGAEIRKNKDLHTASLDRIDNTKGYIKNNIQWIHKDLQQLTMKINNDEELFDWIKKIYEHKQLDRQ